MHFDALKTKENLVGWIRDWFNENGPDCVAVIGLSGGKDSNVVAALCVEALGNDRVVGVTMPNTHQTDVTVLEKDLQDVKRLADALDIRLLRVPIHGAYFDTLLNVSKALDGFDNVSEQTKINLSPRIRMATLYAVSQSLNGRVANTCNLSEEYIGYSTRYGDGGTGDFAPLHNLTVTEILEIGQYLSIPYELVSKAPADGLCGKTDEENIGFSYAVLDEYIRSGVCEDENIKKAIEKMHDENEFKRKPIPAFIV